LRTRVEIKNLNSLRALTRSMEYEIERQAARLSEGQAIRQETLGWDENAGHTYSQRSKEEAHDYRYFPEPDLPPLEVSPQWLEQVRRTVPELPDALCDRLVSQFGLGRYDAEVLVAEKSTAEYFERAVKTSGAPGRTVAAWLTGDLFGLLNTRNLTLEGQGGEPVLPAEEFGALIRMVSEGKINGPTGKSLLVEMIDTRKTAEALVSERSLGQITDEDALRSAVRKTLAENPDQVASLRGGKTSVIQWLLGQVMKTTGGRANPQTVRKMLEEELARGSRE